MVIGKNVLTYRELVAAMTKCHKTIEVIRGVPTGALGPNFPNAKLRTDPGNLVAPARQTQLTRSPRCGAGGATPDRTRRAVRATAGGRRLHGGRRQASGSPLGVLTGLLRTVAACPA
jgi:hypothetical protein